MRGKVCTIAFRPRVIGITPAYAGKSMRQLVAAYDSGDHPRVCGEKHEPARAQGLIVGSPPRMRGKALLS